MEPSKIGIFDFHTYFPQISQEEIANFDKG